MTVVDTTAASTELATVQEPAGALGLLSIAIKSGLPVESIEKLVILHREEQDRAAQREFARALAEFQETCPSVPKTSTAKIVTKSGTDFGYAYAELDQIAETVGPHLHKLGFSYSWDSVQEGGTMRVVCKLRHRDGHRETATFAAPVDASGAMSAVQRTASALTYARRQSLVQALGLTTTEPDTDAGMRDSDPITEEQAADLESLLTEVKANRNKFLDFVGVKALSDIPQSQYVAAVRALERKRALPSAPPSQPAPPASARPMCSQSGCTAESSGINADGTHRCRAHLTARGGRA